MLSGSPALSLLLTPLLASLSITLASPAQAQAARGMLALGEIAHAAGVTRLGFGSIDYMADLDIPADSLALDYADMAHARSLGFGAKMCIHPAQVTAVRAALAPGAQELDWAGRGLQAWGTGARGAIQVDGKMVGRPVILKAERIVALAGLTT